MKNPFDIQTQEIQFTAFQQITNAIDHWMLEKYPKFDNRLLQRLQEVENLQNEFKLVINDFRLDTRGLKKREADEFKEEIKRFLKKDYPDISSSMFKFKDEIEVRLRKMQVKEKLIDEKLKKVIISSSLCEDVYKMRDEFKQMKSFMEGFSKKLKKAFET